MKNDFKFRIADQDYILSFNPSSDMSQTNVKYGTTKKVKRRPGKFVSKDDVSQIQRYLCCSEGCPIQPHRNGPYKPCVDP